MFFFTNHSAKFAFVFAIVLAGVVLIFFSNGSSASSKVRIDFAVSTSDSHCNDTLDDWEKWINENAQKNCSKEIVSTEVFSASREYNLEKVGNIAEIPNGTIVVDLLLISAYEPKLPLCMASISMGALEKSNQSTINKINGVNFMFYNSVSARKLIQEVEGEILKYIRSTCDQL